MQKFAPPKDPAKVRIRTRELPILDLMKTQYLLTFDGAAKQKTKLGSAGYVLWKLPGWEVIKAKGHKCDGGTVNTQEYYSIMEGLKQAREQGIKEITCFGDSRLIVDQLNAMISVHDPTLQKLHATVCDLIKQFDYCKVYQVPRAYNASADFLAGQVLKQVQEVIPTSEQMQHLRSINLLPIWLKEVTEESQKKQEANQSPQVNFMTRQCYITTRSGRQRLHETTVGRKPKTDIKRPRARKPEDTDAERLEFQQHLTRFDEELSNLTLQRRQRIKEAQRTIPWMITVIQHLQGHPVSHMNKKTKRIMRESLSRFFLTPDEILVRRGVTKGKARKQPAVQWVIPPSLRDDIMRAYHNESIAGHLGQDMTYYRIAEHFWWPKLRETVRHHVRSCLDCQAGKGYPRNRGKRKKNICPTHPMQYVSLDFVGPFPESNNGYKYVCVIQDMFTRMVWLVPMTDVTAWETATLYYREILCKFGASAFVRSERGSQFLSEMFQMVMKLFGQKHNATLAYRPQGNGQNERTHSVIFSCVKLFCLDPEQKDWDEYLQQMAFALNTAYRQDVGETPFYLFHGWDPYFPMEAMLQKSRHQYKEYDQKRWRNQTMREWSYVRRHVETTLIANKEKLIAKSTEWGLPIKAGDRVWVWVPKVKTGYSKKLAFRWIGPYRVEKVTNDGIKVTIKVPTRNGIYPEVHYDRLKKCYDERDRPTTPPEDQEELSKVDFTESLENFPDPQEVIPLMDEDGDLIPVPQEHQIDPDEYEVEAILDRKQEGRLNKKFWRYLIKWKGYDDSHNTWEKEENLYCGDLLYDFKKALRSQGREVALQLETHNEDSL